MPKSPAYHEAMGEWDRDARDLLIELRTEVRNIRTDILEIKTGTSTQLLDHETRLRLIERRVWVASGMAAILGATGNLLIQAMLKIPLH
jgi:hypothetical protein